MDERQNQNAEPGQTPTPAQGGQRVIQPTATFTEEMKTQQVASHPAARTDQIPETNQSTTDPSANIQPAAQQQKTVVSSSAVSGEDNPVSTTISASDGYKPKKHWLRWSIVVLVLVIVSVCGVLFGTNYNLRATVLNSKFREYSYSNDESNYKLVFYKNSKIEKDPSATDSNENAIVSPPMSASSLPLQLIITKVPSSTSQSTISQAENCSLAGFSTTFTVYIPVAGNDVKVCSISVPGTNGDLYVATLTDSNNHEAYSLTTGWSFNAQQLQTSPAYDKQLQEELGPIDQYQNDIKSIIGSISST